MINLLRLSTLAIFIGLAFLSSDGLAGNQIIIGDLSNLDPDQKLTEAWEPLIFPKIKKHTAYTLIREDRRTVVKAHSQASASGMIRNLRIDTSKYPWLVWRWKIDHVLKKGDVSGKQSDDYAARIYVGFQFDTKGAGWWRRMLHKSASIAAGKKLPGTSLTYIWANRAPQGAIVDNPYTDQVKMIVLQTGNSMAKQWVQERRNLKADYVLAFGRQPPPVVGIAIMTDTDNTGEEATAYYGDIILEAAVPP